MKACKTIEPMKTIRKNLAKNLICKRNVCKQFRDYCNYISPKTKIQNLEGNLNFVNNMYIQISNLESDYKLLCSLYYEATREYNK